jgi:hypothetical protein
MVRTEEAKNEAARQPELTLVAESAPWEIYEVANSDIVVGLGMQPVVVEERLGDGDGASDPRERLLEIGASWFQQPDEWVAMPAEGGPDSWQRIDVVPDLDRRLEAGDPNGPRVDIVVPAEPIEPVPLPEVAVSNVVVDDQSLSFDVDQVGVPVLVKVSYFPNWSAAGAEGPWRIGPNMMVVVPTDTSVELTYGRTAADYLSILLTLFGVSLCFWWRREGDIVHAGPTPAGFGKLPDDPAPDGADVASGSADGHAPRDEWTTDRRTEVDLVPVGVPDDATPPTADEPPVA